MLMPEKFTILGVHISRLTLDRAWQAITQLIDQGVQEYICVAPVSTIMECQDNGAYCDVVNQAILVTPDGMPIVWLAKLKGLQDVKRTYGPELLPKVVDLGRSKQLRHYFYGATDAVLNQLKKTLLERYPDANIVGMFSPPVREVGEIEDDTILDKINEAEPDIIWVGLGSPKQDFWMAHHRAKLRAPLLVGVGAAFDFLAGVKPQAPQWMRSIGLEWLFRLSCEPGRLWRRYVFGNTRFVYLIIKRLLINQSIG